MPKDARASRSVFRNSDGTPLHPMDALPLFGYMLAPLATADHHSNHTETLANAAYVLTLHFKEMEDAVSEWCAAHAVTGKDGAA